MDEYGRNPAKSMSRPAMSVADAEAGVRSMEKRLSVTRNGLPLRHADGGSEAIADRNVCSGVMSDACRRRTSESVIRPVFSIPVKQEPASMAKAIPAAAAVVLPDFIQFPFRLLDRRESGRGCGK